MRFPPLRRPCTTSPRLPLHGTRGLLRWPCSPCCRPALQRFHRAQYSRPPPSLPLCAGLSPWWLCAPASLSAAEGAFLVSPPPDRTSPCSSLTMLSYVPHAVTFHVPLPHPTPPAFVTSSSVAEPSNSPVLSPLHSSLASLLLSWPSSSRGALPLRRHCLSGLGALSGPVLRVPALPSSSFSWPSSSSSSPSCCTATLLRPHSSFLFWRFTPLLPLDPCGNLPLPAHPFPRPWQPISPVGTNMSEIG